MTDILRRAGRAALFDRRPYLQAQWEASATADAALLVVVVAAVVAVVQGATSGVRAIGFVPFVLQSVISSLASWLFLAVATWFMGSRFFTPPEDHRRRFEYVQVVLRMHGLAFLPVVLSAVGAIGAVVGWLWYLAGAALGTSVALDAKLWQGGIAVLLGAALVALLRAIIGAPFALL